MSDDDKAGHCRHCWNGCAATTDGWHLSTGGPGGFAWASGTCVRCAEISEAVTAEAERIAVAIWSAAADRRVASMGLTASVEAAYGEAIKIARGE